MEQNFRNNIYYKMERIRNTKCSQSKIKKKKKGKYKSVFGSFFLIEKVLFPLKNHFL